MAPTEMADSTSTRWQADLRRAGRRVVIGMVAGMACGALVGGALGRLGMLVLRLTSDDHVRGLRTADSFVIGRFSRSTLFLLALTAVLGGVGGLLYLVVRGWVPERLRRWATGGFMGLTVGSVVVEPGRRDFTLLEPSWLAVVLFLSLPALYGASLNVVVERFLARPPPAEEDGGWLSIAPLALLGLCGPPGLILLSLLVGGWALGRRYPRFRGFWRSSGFRWAGRVPLLLVGVVSLVDLADNLTKIL